MQFSEVDPTLLCVLSPFALGWLLLALVAGIRGQWEAGARLLLLGVGLFSVILVVIASFFYLPERVLIVLLSIGALLPVVSMVRYWVASRVNGKLLLALPPAPEKRSTLLMGGAIFIFLGVQNLFFQNRHLAVGTSYALGVLFLSVGISNVTQRIRYSQILEKGILYETGSFYTWDKIESYRWKFGEDKLSLTLRNSYLKKPVNLKLLSQYRHEVVSHLSEHIDNTATNAQEYVPIHKMG